MKIEFYIPKDEKVPTQLRMYADGHYVIYNRLEDRFGYDFMFMGDVSADEAVDLAKEIASVMCDQSYDHGAQWRVVSVDVLEQEERYKIGEIVRVIFRVRDAG